MMTQQQNLLAGLEIPPPPSADRAPGLLMLVTPGLLLVLCCLAPFLNKAYTIDDPTFLLEARQILKSPFQPMSFPICWTAAQVCVKHTGSFGIGSGQALMGYALVPVILAGGTEWIAHAAQIILACVALIGMVRLALRLGFSRTQAGAAGLLLVAVPPFLPMTSTAMPDVLALALGLTGMERLFAWKDERRWSQALTAGLMLGLAPWARPHWIMVLALCSLWLFDDFRISSMVDQLRRQAYLWAPVLLAVFVLVTVNLATRQRGPVVDTIRPLTDDAHPYRNLLSYLLYLAIPIPFVPVWLMVHWRKLPFLLAPAVAVAALVASMHPAGGLASQWALLAEVCTAPILAHLFYVFLRRRDRTGLLLALWLLCPLPAVAYAHFPVKYMLMIMPAAALIMVQSLSSLSKSRAIAIFGVIATVCAGYSLVILKADDDIAEFGRRAARELISPYAARGEKVWYAGGFGFYWYAQQAGAEVAQLAGPGPGPGQLLAVGISEYGDVTRDRFPNRVLVDRREYDAPHGRTMFFGGGLYSNLIGNTLWVWKPEAKNIYELWRIQ